MAVPHKRHSILEALAQTLWWINVIFQTLQSPDPQFEAERFGDVLEGILDPGAKRFVGWNTFSELQPGQNQALPRLEHLSIDAFAELLCRLTLPIPVWMTLNLHHLIQSTFQNTMLLIEFRSIGRFQWFALRRQHHDPLVQ